MTLRKRDGWSENTGGTTQRERLASSSRQHRWRTNFKDFWRLLYGTPLPHITGSRLPRAVWGRRQTTSSLFRPASKPNDDERTYSYQVLNFDRRQRTGCTHDPSTWKILKKVLSFIENHRYRLHCSGQSGTSAGLVHLLRGNGARLDV